MIEYGKFIIRNHEQLKGAFVLFFIKYNKKRKKP